MRMKKKNKKTAIVDSLMEISNREWKCKKVLQLLLLLRSKDKVKIFSKIRTMGSLGINNC